MPRFEFIALSADGREYRGTEDAISEGALETRLRNTGRLVARMEEIRPRFQSEWLNNLGTARVPRRVLTEFFLQLSLQLRAGIPLITALSNEVGESSHPALARVVNDLSERVGAGQTFSEAMLAHPRVFGRLVVNLFKAGEVSGKMAETSNQVRLHLEWQERLIADVRQALTYPAVVLGCALLFVFIVFTFLVPRFAKLLTEINIPLPMLTRVVMGLSDFMVHHMVLILGSGIASAALVYACLRLFPALSLQVDRLKLGVPVLGELWRMIGLSRFAQNLSIIYQAGITLPEALALVGGLTGNRVLEEAINDIRRGVNEGRQMHVRMASHPVFSKLVLQMVAVGETTGSLGTALENVASYYNEVLPRQVKRMFTLLEPMMILGLVGFVGIVALSIFLPIVSLLSL